MSKGCKYDEPRLILRERNEVLVHGLRPSWCDVARLSWAEADLKEDR